MTAVDNPASGTTDAVDLFVSPLGRVEGDLDVRVTIEDGVVTSAWTEAAMFRGFEIILKGKDPQAGLVVTPRICGICGGSHLYKACYALDTAWSTHVPQNATPIRNIAQAGETLQSIPATSTRSSRSTWSTRTTRPRRCTTRRCAGSRRTSARRTRRAWCSPTSRSRSTPSSAASGRTAPFMVPGGVMSAPNRPTSPAPPRSSTTGRTTGSRRSGWAARSTAGWRSSPGRTCWPGSTRTRPGTGSDCGFFIRCLDIGLDKYGGGCGSYIAPGTYLDPTLYENPTVEGRQDALIGRGGVYANGQYLDYDQLRVSEDVTHSFFKGDRPLHPWEGETNPLDPRNARGQGKYSWAKSPRYDVPGLGRVPLEAGPLARRVAAAAPDPAAHQDSDPLFADMLDKLGPSVFVRQMARMHEGPKYFRWVMDWLSQIDLGGSFYTKPEELESGKGWGATEAARGALQDWIVIENGKIENYQVVTPTAWNIGPRDSEGTLGPIEQALVGTPIVDMSDPVELGHVARSFDSCLVCTVHAYDGRTGRELTKFVVNGMV
ncbi:MAG: nickel-dependent hydrogenase large subunit [Nocardioides sp.]